MNVGERIAQRRKELGLSQDELAARMGYASKSAVSRAETAGDKIGQKRMLLFAEALATTPSYLMGWDEEVNDAELQRLLDADFVGKLLAHPNLLETVKKMFSLRPENYQIVSAMIDKLYSLDMNE